MKSRSPVDFDLAGFQPSAPPFQAFLGQSKHLGVVGERQSAPGLRFNVHGPERLDGARSGVARSARSLVALGFTRQFGLGPQGFGAFDPDQSTPKCLLGQTVLAAINPPRKPAPAPRLDMRRPPFEPGLVPDLSRRHRRSSHARRYPIWTASFVLESV